MLNMTELTYLADDTPQWDESTTPDLWPTPLKPLLKPADQVPWSQTRHLTWDLLGQDMVTHALEMTSTSVADLSEGITLGAQFLAFSAHVRGRNRFLGAVARYCIVQESTDDHGRVSDEWDHWTGWRGWSTKAPALGWLRMDHTEHLRVAQGAWGMDLALAGVEVTA